MAFLVDEYMSLIAKCCWIILLTLIFTSNSIANGNNSQNTCGNLSRPINNVDLQKCEQNSSGYPCLKDILYGEIKERTHRILKRNRKRNAYRMYYYLFKKKGRT